MTNIIITDKNNGKAHQFHHFPITLGRLKECDLVVGGKNISKKHAKIEEREDGFYLLDLCSLNGVFLNGKKISDTKLNHNDEIKLGTVLLHFQDDEATSAGASSGMDSWSHSHPPSDDIIDIAPPSATPQDALPASFDPFDDNPRKGSQQPNRQEPIKHEIQTNETQAASAVTSDQITILGDHSYRHLLYDLISSTTMSISIMSQNLDRALFDNDQIISLLTTFIRRHKTTSIKILVNDITEMTQSKHKLIELYHKLPSNISIKKTSHNKVEDIQDAYIILDNIKILHQANPSDLNIVSLEYTPSHLLMSKSTEFLQNWKLGTEPASLRFSSS